MPEADTCPAKLWSRAAAPDVLTCGYLTLIGLLATVFAERIPQWWWYPLTHAMVILALGIFLLKTPPEACRMGTLRALVVSCHAYSVYL